VKTKKFVEDLRTKSATELDQELVAAKKELFNLRFQNATNQLDNTNRITEVRRNIARIQTVITTRDEADKKRKKKPKRERRAIREKEMANAK